MIPVEEKRMLGMMEKQRIHKIRRHAAATLIQQAWRRYLLNRQMKLEIYEADTKNFTIKNMKTFKKTCQLFNKKIQVFI